MMPTAAGQMVAPVDPNASLLECGVYAINEMYCGATSRQRVICMGKSASVCFPVWLYIDMAHSHVFNGASTFKQAGIKHVCPGSRCAAGRTPGGRGRRRSVPVEH